VPDFSVAGGVALFRGIYRAVACRGRAVKQKGGGEERRGHVQPLSRFTAGAGVVAESDSPGGLCRRMEKIGFEFHRGRIDRRSRAGGLISH